MANPEHLVKLAEGLKAWNLWRKQFPAEIPNLSRADLADMDLEHANLEGAVLAQARLTGAQLCRANLMNAKLRRANFSNAVLSDARLCGTDLSEANFSGAKLSGADLTSASLRKTNFRSADLRGADLELARGFGADFFMADLSQADLSRAGLQKSTFASSNLANASAFGADMTGAHFQATQMSGLDLRRAAFGSTVFIVTDLGRATGLESTRHLGPSYLDITTILRSGGRIPDSFLRGCGVPEDFISYAKSLATNPIQFYSCFISYSTKDQDFADRLYADLQNKGVRCWFAPHDVQGGRKLHEQIDEAIRLHDKLLLILSAHSMESEWVKTEIAKARTREVRDKRRVLFPIRLAPFEALRDWECFDADTGKDSAREIREYFIPDFSNWKNHDSYQEAFHRLISDLKASDSKVK